VREISETLREPFFYFLREILENLREPFFVYQREPFF
jgi:hypothetical protein